MLLNNAIVAIVQCTLFIVERVSILIHEMILSPTEYSRGSRLCRRQCTVEAVDYVADSVQ